MNPTIPSLASDLDQLDHDEIDHLYDQEMDTFDEENPLSNLEISLWIKISK
jgi:hypothetical protein